MLLTALAVLAVATAPAGAPRLAPAELGPHTVGFSMIEVEAGAETAPLRIGVWRPIGPHGDPEGGAKGEALTLGGLAALLCPEVAASGAAWLSGCLPDLSDAIAALGGADDAARAEILGAAAGLSLTAVQDGAPETGDYPLLVLSGSLRSRGGDFIVLAEAIASHGYVVAVVSDLATAAGFDAATEERKRAQLARAVAVLKEKDVAAGDEFALGAWSFSGAPASLLLMTEPNARALISYDSALRYAYGAALIRAASGYDPLAVKAGLLLFEPGLDNAVAKDTGVVEAMTCASKVRMLAPAYQHADFNDLRGALTAPWRDGAARAAFEGSFDLVVRTTIRFLDATMKGEGELEGLAREEGGEFHGRKCPGD